MDSPPVPLWRPSWLATATWSMTMASLYGLFRNAASVWAARILLGMVLVVIATVTGTIYLAYSSPIAACISAALTTSAVLVFFLVASLLSLLFNWFVPNRVVRASDGGQVVLTASRSRTEQMEWTARSLSSWPRGHNRAQAFLTELLAREVDPNGITIHATAGNRDLFTKLYQPQGFTITGELGSRRPKITRTPR
jgi:membrane protein implicated in regulation of membrane protease activity